MKYREIKIEDVNNDGSWVEFTAKLKDVNVRDVIVKDRGSNEYEYLITFVFPVRDGLAMVSAVTMDDSKASLGSKVYIVE